MFSLQEDVINTQCGYDVRLQGVCISRSQPLLHVSVAFSILKAAVSVVVIAIAPLF